MRTLIFALCCFFSTLAFAQLPRLSPNAPEDKPRALEADELQAFEAAIAPYVAEAKKTYPAARARFLQGLPSGQHFFVTTRLYDDSGNFEQVFIAVQTIGNDKVSGLIASNLRRITEYKAGDLYSFPETEVMDWLISYPDGPEEGNFIGKYLDSYSGNGT